MDMDISADFMHIFDIIHNIQFRCNETDNETPHHRFRQSKSVEHVLWSVCSRNVTFASVLTPLNTNTASLTRKIRWETIQTKLVSRIANC